MIFRCTMCGIVFSAPLHVINCFLGGWKTRWELNTFMSLGRIVFVGVSTRVGLVHITQNQIQEIHLKLQQAPAHKIKLIAAHQPFYTPPDHSHGVKDCPMLGRIALEQWSQHGLNGLLHGHLHHAAVYDLNQIYQLGVSHPVLDIHAGTATSYRLHAGLPNSLNIILPNADVQHLSFNAETNHFELMQQNTSD